MAATILSTPYALAYIANPMPVQISTDRMAFDQSELQITITASGPASGETLTLKWPGGSITYTVGTPDATALKWRPKTGGETLAQYTDDIADFLREREDLSAVFTIERTSTGGETIRLIAKRYGAYILDHTNGMANIAVTEVQASDTTPLNLRALVQVWAHGPNFNAHLLLSEFHSPYRTDGGTTIIDISAAFASLQPQPPQAAGINPDSPNFATDVQIITLNHMKYHFRYADKYGSPAIAEALKTQLNYDDEPFLAFWGGFAGDNTDVSIENLLHAYVDAQGQPFWKPVCETQPDWLYFWMPETVTGIILVEVEWNDGDTESHTPYGATDRVWEAGKCYAVPAGPRQLFLHTLPGATPGRYVSRYKVWLGISPLHYASRQWEALYQVERGSEWGLMLLYENGLGGCETVALAGKKDEKYLPENQEYPVGRDIELESPRSAFAHDFNTFAHKGRVEWEASTHWMHEDYYVRHLRQLPLSRAVWLIDLPARKFKAVTVEAKEMTIQADDQPLQALTFIIRSAWEDVNSNLPSAL